MLAVYATYLQLAILITCFPVMYTNTSKGGGVVVDPQTRTVMSR